MNKRKTKTDRKHKTSPDRPTQEDSENLELELEMLMQQLEALLISPSEICNIPLESSAVD